MSHKKVTRRDEESFDDEPAAAETPTFDASADSEPLTPAAIAESDSLKGHPVVEDTPAPTSWPTDLLDIKTLGGTDVSNELPVGTVLTRIETGWSCSIPTGGNPLTASCPTIGEAIAAARKGPRAAKPTVAPVPGSELARKQKCTCASVDSIDAACPIHDGNRKNWPRG